jgi:hypothetical protein
MRGKRGAAHIYTKRTIDSFQVFSYSNNTSRDSYANVNVCISIIKMSAKKGVMKTIKYIYGYFIVCFLDISFYKEKEYFYYI